jgi:hypothetical protein
MNVLDLAPGDAAVLPDGALLRRNVLDDGWTIYGDADDRSGPDGEPEADDQPEPAAGGEGGP